MRISDWSSDVCSSDLAVRPDLRLRDTRVEETPVAHRPDGIAFSRLVRLVQQGGQAVDRRRGGQILGRVGLDRKSVVQGKSVSVRVDLGGRRILKKKKQQYM